MIFLETFCMAHRLIKKCVVWLPNIWEFSCIFLLFIYTIISLWLENILFIFQFFYIRFVEFFQVPRFALTWYVFYGLLTRSIFCSSWVECVQLTIKSYWLMVLLSSSIYLLIFWQVILPVVKRGILKYLTIFLDLSFFLVLIFVPLIFQLCQLVHIHLGLLYLLSKLSTSSVDNISLSLIMLFVQESVCFI